MLKINSTLILIIIIILMGLGMWYMYSEHTSLKRELEISEQNTSALSDSLRVITTKNGDLVYSKGILVTDKENLSNLNKDLNKELKKLEGKILELNKTIFTLEMELDTLYNNELVMYADSTYGIKWETHKKYGNDNVRYLSGVTNFRINPLPFEVVPLNTIITRDYFSMSLISGLRKNGAIVEGFVVPGFPGMKVKDMSGAIVDPKNHPLSKPISKRFSLGGYFGYGGTYVPSDHSIYFGFQGGVGASFKLF